MYRIISWLIVVVALHSAMIAYADDDWCAGVYSPNNPYDCCDNGNGDEGNCTWWAWHCRQDLPAWSGNAATWLTNAENDDIDTGTTPLVGSIACFPNMAGGSGHVAYVTSVHLDGSFDVTEMNCWPGFNGVDAKLYSSGSAAGFIYGGPVNMNYSLTYAGQSPTDPSGILKLRPLETVNCWLDVNVLSGSAPISNDPNSPYFVELRSVDGSWQNTQSSELQGPDWLSWYRITAANGGAGPGQTARFSFQIRTPGELGRVEDLRLRLFHPHTGDYIGPTGWTVPVEVQSYYNRHLSECAPGGNCYLWKTYTVNMPTADRVTVFVTGKAEYTSPGGDDSDLKLVINGADLGWNSDKALDGGTLGRDIKTIATTHDFVQGNNTIRIYADEKPCLYNVLVVPYYPRLLADSEAEWRAPGGTGNYIWFTYHFYVHASDTYTVKITGKAGHYETPSDDDDARFVLDGCNYGWNNNRSLDGNAQNGQTRTITLTRQINSGWRTLIVHADRKPRITSLHIERGTGGQYKLAPDDGEGTFDDEPDPIVPEVARLALSVSPTPFSSETSVAYTLPQAGHVSLGIYNVSGRMVAVLVNEHQPAGNHSVRWLPENQALGIYFCRLKFGSENSTKKIVLLK